MVPRMFRPQSLAVALVLLIAVGACTSPEPGPSPSAPPTPTPTLTPTPTPIPTESPTVALLTVAVEKDGDSFVASDGVEYRVGMINTAERGECGGAEAADRAYELMAEGFTVEAYATDDFDRSVARVSTAAGDLGVLLAREGLADDRYLEPFAHQHPAYADELAQAFAAAEAERAGLWRTCWADGPWQGADPEPFTPAPDLTPGQHTGRTGEWPCHPDYVECIPDGPDLDCGQIDHQVRLFGQADPFRLDGNDTTAIDGTGCDTYPVWSPTEAYPYY